jgi:tRNA(Leu) C34 or U34 (ribose-2'-O)-methylase TrmL
MKEGVISMNLSDCVSIVLYEALRQEGFAGLS